MTSKPLDTPKRETDGPIEQAAGKFAQSLEQRAKQ
jgi:hypothetical protein